MFLKQWVKNLLENPPSLKVFLEKEHYYVLRREQADLLKDTTKLAQLEALYSELCKPRRPSRNKELLKAFAKLDLSPLLVTGPCGYTAGQQ